jgi:hypothetical protein
MRRRSALIEHALRLPMAGRVRLDMKTICDSCRQPITDEFFYGCFQANGGKNLKLHEACTPDAVKALVEEHACPQCNGKGGRPCPSSSAPEPPLDIPSGYERREAAADRAERMERVLWGPK